MRKIVLPILCFLLLFLACDEKEADPVRNCISNGVNWLEKDDFFQAVALERQSKNGKFHLDGYGNFNGYFSILANEIVFNQKKGILSFKRGWIFPDNLPNEDYIEDEKITKVCLKKGEFIFSAENNCRNKVIVIHQEKTDIVTVFVCRRINNEIIFKQIFKDESFTVSTWGWYNRVFSSQNTEMAVEK